MGHRTIRDHKTAPRRIHATQDEWDRMRAAAARAGKSVSAFAVEACLRRAASQPRPKTIEAVRLLTASHAALMQLADRQLASPLTLSTFGALAQLSAIEDQLSHVTALIGKNVPQEARAK
ncbi:plasmid mobilization protein [Sulfitobacter sp. 1A13353]|uniref:plasmid mobilization protein n=1 Tax=Sulfitobacter sp. 1A13353 TaxID=3368568 RepID=UPI003746ED5A